MNSALFLLIVLNICTLFHVYVRSPWAQEVKTKFICNVKQLKLKTNTKAAHDNEDNEDITSLPETLETKM